MKIVFLTEMRFNGKIDKNYPNMRTEFAWMEALNAEHYSLLNVLNDEFFEKIDANIVFIIWPKNKEYYKKVDNKFNIPDLIIDKLKEHGKKVCFIQEGPANYFQNYETVYEQQTFLSALKKSDCIFAHNEKDVIFYLGLLPHQNIFIIPTLMNNYMIKDIKHNPEDKVIVGGNCTNWYNGHISKLIADDFNLPIDVAKSGRMLKDEVNLFDNILPWSQWKDWMKNLSKYKYAVHLMPTEAAGTFSLNCAYFGIPCIGNENIDTQKRCFPDLSIRNNDLISARQLVKKLKNNRVFYETTAKYAKTAYKTLYNKENFISHINNCLRIMLKEN